MYLKENLGLLNLHAQKRCFCSIWSVPRHSGFDVVWVSGLGRRDGFGCSCRRLCPCGLPKATYQGLLLEGSYAPELDGIRVKSILEGEQERCC